MSVQPTARELGVWLNDQRIGLLGEAGNLWRFRYAEEWLANPQGFDLSPALPRSAVEIVDGGSQRPVQWFFDNLLPEEDARQLLAQDARIPVADAFGLLTWFGAESAGALTLLPTGTQPQAGGWQALPDEELSARIRRLPQLPLSHAAPKRMSLAGAQHKLAVVWNQDRLGEPVGHTPSTHILKPDHPQKALYPHSAANEWFVMRLAAALGLPVPAVALRHVPESVYLVARFDRSGNWPQLRREHVLDACQLLSLDRAFKYQQSTLANLQRLIGLCRTKAATRQALYRWAVFNALVGNGDAHLKNLSFFVGAQGVRLTPHYDLLSTCVYLPPGTWGDAELSWPMGTARRFAELERSQVLAFGEALGLPARLGARLLDELLESIAPAADALLAGLNPPASAPLVDAGEQRLLRSIRFGVLRDMLDRLQAGRH